MGAEWPLTGGKGKRFTDVRGIDLDNRPGSALLAGHDPDLDTRLDGQVEDDPERANHVSVQPPQSHTRVGALATTRVPFAITGTCYAKGATRPNSAGREPRAVSRTPRPRLGWYISQMSTLSTQMAEWLRQQVSAAGVRGIVLGLSGGIDSAVVARVAQMAVGDNVLGVIMPAHSNPQDAADARLVAETFKLATVTVDLSDPVRCPVRRGEPRRRRARTAGPGRQCRCRQTRAREREARASGWPRSISSRTG